MSNRPIESFVSLRTVYESPSVCRKHPSHYVQRANGEVLYYPRIPETTLTLPDEVKKPKVVGSFGLSIIQCFQAIDRGMSIFDLLKTSPDFDELQGLFVSDPLLPLQFRTDLAIEPAFQIMVLDKFNITEAICDHEGFKADCIDEINRTFSPGELAFIFYEKVGVAEATLSKLKFKRISGTKLCFRDNGDHWYGNWAKLMPPLPEPGMSGHPDLRNASPDTQNILGIIFPH